MSDRIRCERRGSCINNENGLCRLAAPKIDQRSAYASCLDQSLEPRDPGKEY